MRGPMTNEKPTADEVAQEIRRISRELQRNYFEPFPHRFSEVIRMNCYKLGKETDDPRLKDLYELMYEGGVMMHKQCDMVAKACSQMNALYESITGTKLTIEQQMFP
jgi:hypothetical protein